MGGSQYYKVKLSSGRILGPLDLDRIRLFIAKGQFTGAELAREYPQGDWKDINSIPELASLFLANLQAGGSKILAEPAPGPHDPMPVVLGPTQVLPGATEILAPQEEPRPVEEDAPLSVIGTSDNEKTTIVTVDDEKTAFVARPAEGTDCAPDASNPAPMPELPSLELDLGSGAVVRQDERSHGTNGVIEPEQPRNLAREETVIFQRSEGGPSASGARKKISRRDLVRATFIAVGLGFAAYDVFFEADSTQTYELPKWQPVKPRMPAYVQGKADPKKSEKLYTDAMRLYIKDTVPDYRAAAEKLLVASSQDPTNVKALAMLASCYLNLIDSSNKDESYFSVINKLIDSSREKSIDLPESVIADVEFFVTVNKAEAAQNRVIEYTKLHQNFGIEMFYYLGYAFFHRGDFASAANYLGRIPDDKVFSPKVFYLRGQVAEGLKDPEAALLQYAKAIQANPNHAKSRLRISDILYQQGRIRDAAKHLDFIATHLSLLAPKDLARAYFLHSQLNQLYKKWELALADIERSVKLDRGNHDYLMEMYTLRAKAGDVVARFRKDARMYFFLGEGEKVLREGKYQDALVHFMQARQQNLKSPLPLVKMGDMFFYLRDFNNARENYKLAAQLAPQDINVWSKYIDVLIQAYEWDEAQAAMEKFRKLPVSQSAIDKAAGDMYARQQRHMEAQVFYKKAMARESIDPDVYIAYAKSLMAVRAYKEAPFFFALARRFDPLNTEALIGIAKCIAESEGVERGISMLQDELQKSHAPNAELLAAVAELNIQRGYWDQAQQFVEQAVIANPEYPYSWKLQAQIHLHHEGDREHKDALDKALDAYKSYSERNLSDPSGYFERYRIFIRKAEFEQAKEELNRIYAIYPKYPNLHYYQGELYFRMGNYKVAVEEYSKELANNPQGVETMIALGKGLLELGDLKSALGHFNKAMQLSPGASEPKHWSGYANFLMKNYQGAVALLNSALAKDKGNPLIYKRLGLAYRAMGDANGARENFRKYLEMEPDAADKAEYEQFL